MTAALAFHISTTSFDESYSPSNHSRITTNFANLARGEHRERNLRDAFTMINNRFNTLAHWDNPTGDRYSVELEIISVELPMAVDEHGAAFPLIEILDTHIVDTHTGTRIPGIVGNNFSSYVRDHDFSVRLPNHKATASELPVPADFGDLHGELFHRFVSSETFTEKFAKPPVICISVSTKATYTQTGNTHPVLGTEYVQDADSLTDQYFGKMGLSVRYFMPQGSVAPLAFYAMGDLLNDYTNLELIGTISTMETFQKIYRPEIYNANSAAARVYRPTLANRDFSRTAASYDREERTALGIQQGKLAEERVIRPLMQVLGQPATSSAN